MSRFNQFSTSVLALTTLFAIPVLADLTPALAATYVNETKGRGDELHVHDFVADMVTKCRYQIAYITAERGDHWTAYKFGFERSYHCPKENYGLKPIGKDLNRRIWSARPGAPSEMVSFAGCVAAVKEKYFNNIALLVVRSAAASGCLPGNYLTTQDQYSSNTEDLAKTRAQIAQDAQAAADAHLSGEAYYAQKIASQSDQDSEGSSANDLVHDNAGYNPMCQYTPGCQTPIEQALDRR